MKSKFYMYYDDAEGLCLVMQSKAKKEPRRQAAEVAGDYDLGFSYRTTSVFPPQSGLCLAWKFELKERKNG